MVSSGKNQANPPLIKIVYFDEESASDLLDIVAGGQRDFFEGVDQGAGS